MTRLDTSVKNDKIGYYDTIELIIPPNANFDYIKLFNIKDGDAYIEFDEELLTVNITNFGTIVRKMNPGEKLEELTTHSINFITGESEALLRIRNARCLLKLELRNYQIAVALEHLRYCTKVDSIFTNYGKMEGNIKHIASCTELQSLTIANANVYGNIEELGNLINCNTINITGTCIYGDVPIMLDRMYQNGRRTGSLTISNNGYLTSGNVLLKGTKVVDFTASGWSYSD